MQVRKNQVQNKVQIATENTTKIHWEQYETIAHIRNKCNTLIHKYRPEKHVQTVRLYMYTAVRSRIVGFMLVLIMEYVRVVKGKGGKYVINNNLFSQYCIRNSKSM